MKKGAAVLLSLACLPAWSLDWKLPVTSVRYEVATGAAEDTDDETLTPSSLRNTVTLRVKEDAEPASFGLTVKYSAKDYFLQAGDYSYIQVGHDGTVRVSDALKLGWDLGGKRSQFPQLDSHGLSRDYLSLGLGTTAALTVQKGSTIDVGATARADLADAPSKALQAYTVSAGFSSRLGEWLLSARYRGEFRLPLDARSEVESAAYNTGSLSLQWDPNR